jgi:uncharacterized membrane protein
VIWPRVLAPLTVCGCPLSRRDATNGRDTRGGHSARGIHIHEEDWLRPDRNQRPRHRLGTGVAIGSRQNIGHVLFLSSALAWACYTVAMRRARLDGLHAAAISAVGALLLYLPAYPFVAGTNLFKASLSDITLQALVQGLLTAVISYLLYGRAVSILGASSGAAFAALCPAMTALLAIPILGEWPTAIDWIAHHPYFCRRVPRERSAATWTPGFHVCWQTLLYQRVISPITLTAGLRMRANGSLKREVRQPWGVHSASPEPHDFAARTFGECWNTTMRSPELREPVVKTE